MSVEHADDTLTEVRRAAMRRLADLVVERKSEAVCAGIFAAATNALHGAWNWWASSNVEAYWASYVAGLHHCFH